MSLVNDIKSYLTSSGITETIYEGLMPNEPDECIALFQYAGQIPLNGAALDRPGLHVRARGTESSAAELMKEVEDILNAVGNEEQGTLPEGVTINSTIYFNIVPQQSAFPMAYDNDNRKVFAQNYYVTRSK